jgi:hypothetical protein
MKTIHYLKSLGILAVLLACAIVGLLLVTPPARAADRVPPCWPEHLDPTGSPLVERVDDRGQWGAWRCVVDGKAQTFVVLKVREQGRPERKSRPGSPTPRAAAPDSAPERVDAAALVRQATEAAEAVK